MICLSSKFMLFLESLKQKQKSILISHTIRQSVFLFYYAKYTYLSNCSSKDLSNYLSKFSRKFICVYVFGMV